MQIKEKIEMLRHVMDRYDHYYDSVNNKGNLYLTLNTFLLGGIITGYYAIKSDVQEQFDVLYFIWTALILCLGSIAYTLLAIIPFISRESDPVNGSLINFNNVANISQSSFKTQLDSLTEIRCYEDYVSQVKALAIGLNRKFSRLRIATYLLAGCFACIVVIGVKILQ
ncbi:Pycsar system effector family protein [Dyadobacter psychrotolerans]|uniref:Pycsar effector protein domain-containing protein n=1 Tax=Dyadobacter psychrotolerans TaxID=2541721 RepID=A0A4R5DVG7_9BACT|nr:Pycsar system effector family protein [Dyadobacter psychrotolerans]TDE16350.1 hypothetical protein E0F88_08870 [Dyadobacter psychrotolerans]